MAGVDTRRNEARTALSAVLLGPVVEGVPSQVVGVGTVGVSGRHGHERGGDAAVAGREDVGDLVGWSAGQPHQRRTSRVVESIVGEFEFGVAGPDHPPETVAPADLGASEHLVHVGDVRPERGVRVRRVVERRLDADRWPMYAQ